MTQSFLKSFNDFERLRSEQSVKIWIQWFIHDSTTLSVLNCSESSHYFVDANFELNDINNDNRIVKKEKFWKKKSKCERRTT